MLEQYLELLRDYTGFEPLIFIGVLFVVLIYFKLKG